jgi:hypothetical protein
MDVLSETLKEVTSALNLLGIRYAIGGSLASSARSIWRTTLDVDIVAAIAPAQAEAFVKSLGKDWYADVDSLRNAIVTGRSFNIIHMRNIQKVDVFPAREPFHQTQLDRATVLPLGEEQIPWVVTTAEDILLAKLRWYREDGEVSDRQWSDIAGILAQNPNLDWPYVDSWAERLKVADLLERAREDVQER